MSFRHTALCCCLLAAAWLPAAGQPTGNRPLPAPQPVLIDSGLRTNSSEVPETVWVEEVALPDAAWLRLYFGEVELGPRSFIRVRALRDGAVQELGAAALEMWSHSTAYFNGDAVTVELVAAPGTHRNRVVIERIAWESAPAVPTGTCGICMEDDRLITNVEWAGRVLPWGCSGAIFNIASCFVTAGHCAAEEMVVEFRVPNSNEDCSLNHPHPRDQFPMTAILSANAGYGEDWAVLTLGTNGLGQNPYDRYGELMPIATDPPLLGDWIQVWGYGIDDECEKSQTQQFHTGGVLEIHDTFFRSYVDMTYGNSGSAIIRDFHEIIGVFTHCRCPGRCTRVDQPVFAAARETLCPAGFDPQQALLLSMQTVTGDHVGGGLAGLATVDGDYVEVDSVTLGSRNNTMIEIAAQSPLTAPSELRVRVTAGLADASPVFLTVALFDHDAGQFRFFDFVIASTVVPTVLDVNLEDPAPYVNDLGDVIVRVAETARASQTPRGFTTLLDWVDVSVVP